MIAFRDLLARGVAVVPGVGFVAMMDSAGKDPVGPGLWAWLWFGAMALAAVLVGMIVLVQGRPVETSLGAVVAFVCGVVAVPVGFLFLS